MKYRGERGHDGYYILDENDKVVFSSCYAMAVEDKLEELNAEIQSSSNREILPN